jgi:hypothetical protein
MNTAYANDRLSSVENNMYGQTVVEMQNEYARWGDPNHIAEQMENFHANHLTFSSQLILRTEQVRNHLQSNFNLPDQVDVTLNVFPPGGGSIQISTITPEAYPWQGVYFTGIPVKIEAIEAEGYHFLYWGNNGLITDTLNTVFLDTLKANQITFDAYFEDITTATITLEQNDDFNLYPNPATDILHLKANRTGSAELKFQILDVTGRTVQIGTIHKGNTETDINIQEIPTSVYLLQINDLNNTLVKQFRFIKSGGF